MHQRLSDDQTARASRHQVLTEVNVGDFVAGLGVPPTARIAPLLRGIMRRAAKQFAAHIIATDEAVGAQGLQRGTATLLPHYVPRFEVFGLEHIPRSGPLLLVANHPGLADALMVLAHVPRPDLRIIAAERPFLQAIPHVAKHLLFVSEDGEGGRLALVRSAARHLRNGGAVLTFPAGRIEPDPALLPGAADSLGDWSASVSLFARVAPGVAIQPVVVSGVLSPRALGHPLVRIRRQPRDREWLAALLQIVLPQLRDTVVRLRVGVPILTDGLTTSAVETAVQAGVCALFDEAARSGPY